MFPHFFFEPKRQYQGGAAILATHTGSAFVSTRPFCPLCGSVETKREHPRGNILQSLPLFWEEFTGIENISFGVKLSPGGAKFIFGEQRDAHGVPLLFYPGVNFLRPPCSRGLFLIWPGGTQKFFFPNTRGFGPNSFVGGKL